ncbi:hypothetical protein [Ruania halotolerans]|uniref:hypothetical protein n=1 Tax=Ruania halotolerans TaxID=2897773 RepID=UPI001E2A15CA|nr:hypothetical protein [Ruania halotolerans]UFU07045.1 hypothetical protein LQF10_02730 [Ruania halotolerans]
MKRHLLVTATTAVGLLALTACGGSSGGAEANDDSGDVASGATAAEAGSALDLAEFCPDTVVMQQDWQPEAEHGSMYQLVGSDYTIDTDNKSVTGSLIVGETDTGVNIEVRPGGPNVGFQAVPALMYLDEDITLGAVNTDAAIAAHEAQPTVAVASQMTNSPQILMWDPQTYPGATTIEEVTSQGAVVVTAGDVIPALLAETVGFDLAQSDTSYEGTPARFVSDTTIMQQGFATAEPYIYENEISEWGRPVGYQLMSEVGFSVYPEPLAVRADKLEELSPCLERLVPIMQQSQIDYLADPEPTNELIVELVEAYDLSWTYSAGVAAFSAQAQLDEGIVTDDPASGVFGQLDPDRMAEIVDTFAPLLEAQGTITDAGAVDPEALYTNEFIDTSISMGQ